MCSWSVGEVVVAGAVVTGVEIVAPGVVVVVGATGLTPPVEVDVVATVEAGSVVTGGVTTTDELADVEIVLGATLTLGVGAAAVRCA